MASGQDSAILTHELHSLSACPAAQHPTFLQKTALSKCFQWASSNDTYLDEMGMKWLGIRLRHMGLRMKQIYLLQDFVSLEKP